MEPIGTIKILNVNKSPVVEISSPKFFFVRSISHYGCRAAAWYFKTLYTFLKQVAWQGPHKLANHWYEDVHVVVRQPTEGIPVYDVQSESLTDPVRTLHRDLLLSIGFVDIDVKDCRTTDSRTSSQYRTAVNAPPSMTTRFLRPSRQMPPHTITDPPSYRSYSTMLLSAYCSPARLHTLPRRSQVETWNLDSSVKRMGRQ